MHVDNDEYIPSVEMDNKPKKNIRSAMISRMEAFMSHMKGKTHICSGCKIEWTLEESL
jgi:hypothetical protein